MNDGTIAALEEQEVRFYSAETHALVDVIELPVKMAEVEPRIPWWTDGSSILVGLSDGSLARIESGELTVIPLRTKPISAVEVSPDGQLLLVGDIGGPVTLVDRSSSRTLWSTQVILNSSLRELWPAQVIEANPWYLDFDPIVFGTGPAAIRFRQTGDILVGADMHLRVLDRESGHIEQSVVVENDEGGSTNTALPRAISDINLEADGSVFVSAGGRSTAASLRPGPSIVWATLG